MYPAIVLLRPEGQSQADAAICHRAGWQPVPLGLMRLVADPVALAQLPQQWCNVDAVFWVSPGAVDMAAACLRQWPARGVHIAVGQATATRLAVHGVADVLFPASGNDSEAVLRLPLWTQRRGSLLIVRGHGGRAYLGDAVRRLGWQVAYAEIYRRQPQAIDWAPLRRLLAAGKLRAVYVTTAMQADDWFAQMPADLCPKLKSLLYLTQHPRVAAALCWHGVNTVQTGSLTSLLPCVLKESSS